MTIRRADLPLTASMGYAVAVETSLISRAMAARILLVLLGAATMPARAGDQWSDPFRGVRYLHRTTASPKWSIHVTVIDLAAPGIRFAATTPDGKRATVGSFARRKKVQVAVNGDFFNLDTRVPVCYAMGEGVHWPGTSDNKEFCGQVAIGGNRVELIAPEADFQHEPWMREVVGGHPAILRDGQAVNQGDYTLKPRHPRTAVGLSRDNRRLFLLVVDGRQSHSVGMTGAKSPA